MKVDQSIFDKVYLGLKSQGFERSMRKNEYGDRICAYRGEDGLKCAAGHLMPNTTFRKSMEGNDVSSISFFRKLGFLTMVANLQRIHDESFLPEEMEANLLHFAKGNGLTIPSEK